jgi:hypothetical protein
MALGLLRAADKTTLRAELSDTMALPTLYQGLAIIATQKPIESSALIFQIGVSVRLAGIFPMPRIVLPVKLCCLQ